MAITLGVFALALYAVFLSFAVGTPDDDIVEAGDLALPRRRSADALPGLQIPRAAPPTGLDDLPPRPVDLVDGRSYSRRATFKGATAPVDGNIAVAGETGHKAAKTLCEQVARSATAHMCTRDELPAAAEPFTPLPVPHGWYAVRKWGERAVVGCEVWDCDGWSTTERRAFGAATGASERRPRYAACGEKLPILCCD